MEDGSAHLPVPHALAPLFEPLTTNRLVLENSIDSPGAQWKQISVADDSVVAPFRQFAARIHRHGAALMCRASPDIHAAVHGSLRLCNAI